MDAALIQRFLNLTVVLRAPSRALSTFGATITPYHLISPVDDQAGKTRLRIGTVRSEKPKILTAEALAKRFEGFGDEAGFAKWISSQYRDLLRALEYNFKNEGFQASVLSESPAAVADRVRSELDAREAKDQAVITCPDSAWSLALMKFTLDEAARSFPSQVKDLERRGMFDPAGKELSRRQAEIEKLFAEAKTDPEVRPILGGKLKEYGLMAEYEDRFLGLF
jgi:hypothetical protein